MCQQPKELDFNLQMQEASILSHTQTADTQTHNTIFLLQAMLAPRYAGTQICKETTWIWKNTIESGGAAGFKGGAEEFRGGVSTVLAERRGKKEGKWCISLLLTFMWFIVKTEINLLEFRSRFWSGSSERNKQNWEKRENGSCRK